jgi:hypothetical protein
MPTDKASFNDIFSVTSSAGRLACRFEIQSDRRTFRSIKMGVWDILQKHGVFFKKSAAPVKKISLSMLDFWVNVHPSFASSHVFRAEICASCDENHKTEISLLDKLRLAHD